MNNKILCNLSLNRNLYNEEVKKKYIDKYSDASKEYVLRILCSAYNSELSMNKDLAEFSIEELHEFFKGFKYNSLAGIHMLVTVVRKYIEYAIENEYTNVKVNNADFFSGKEKLSELLNMKVIRKSYITRDQLHDIIDFCVNDQDSALFGLIFEGVKPFDELINLRKKDINCTTGEILLTKDNGYTRNIIIKDKIVLDVINYAIYQIKYLKNNGEYLRTPSFDLVDSEYVFRVSGKVKVDKVTERTLRERINKICRLYGIETKYLNPKNIWLSGMIDFAKKIKDEENKDNLQKEDYVKINERFGYDTKYWYSTKRIIEEFL